MERPEYEALYGGAAGGGEIATRCCARRCGRLHIPHYRAPDPAQDAIRSLRELIDRSAGAVSARFPRRPVYRATAHVLDSSRAGAKIYFGNHAPGRRIATATRDKRYDYHRI